MSTATAGATRLVVISTYRSKSDNEPVHLEVEWGKFAAGLTQHMERTTKDAPLWSPARIEKGKTRASENAVEVAAFVLDGDDGILPADLSPAWARWEYVIHSTF